MLTRRDLLCTLALATALPAQAAAPFVNYSRRDDVRVWAAMVSQEKEIPFDWILSVLTKARYSSSTEKIMSRPAFTAGSKPRNWTAHLASSVTPERITAGRLFLEENRKTFVAVRERWDVPSEIVAAIIGIETGWGKNMGRIRVIDALCTLSFDYLRRAEYFSSELAAFLAWCHRLNVDPLSVSGSFAGAFGMCQFMPSNIDRVGVDFDGDGIVDLRNSAPDAIASVANYLSVAGWKNDLPVVWHVESSEAVAKELDVGGITPNTTIQNALDAGLTPLSFIGAPADTSVLLANFPVVNKDGSEGALWRLGTQNFAALLDYNHSYFYAESVRVLAQELASSAKPGTETEAPNTTPSAPTFTLNPVDPPSEVPADQVPTEVPTESPAQGAAPATGPAA